MTDSEAVTRAIELLLNSLYPAQRIPVLEQINKLYPTRPVSTPPERRRESCRRCGEVRLVNQGGFCQICSGIWPNTL